MSGNSVQPIVIVTGGNRGVGFGICHRLLIQLSHSSPPDSVPPRGTNPMYEVTTPSPCHGITIVIACRDMKQAEKSRTKLLRLLDASIARRKKSSKYDGHAEKFRQGVKIETCSMDLAIGQSILDFAKLCETRFPYVSHLICNAGMAPFSAVDGPGFLRQLFRSPASAVTTPNYLLQTPGLLSNDGFGLVWQCNVFGHYMLYRSLRPLFERFSQQSGLSPRIIWMSTLTAAPGLYEPDDWQLVKTLRPYEASKYQLDIIAAYLNMAAAESGDPAETPKPCHFVVQPGVLETTLDPVNSKGVPAFSRSITLWAARLLNSHNHPTTPHKAAISAAHAALVPIKPTEKPLRESWAANPCKLHSRSPILRREYVRYAPYPSWTQADMEQASQLVQNYDVVYSKFPELAAHVNS